MLFWLIVVGYILVGTIVGRLAYNWIIDDIYKDYYNRYKRSGYSAVDAETKAYKNAKDSSDPNFAGSLAGILWPVTVVIFIVAHIAFFLGWLSSKILPAPQMEKQRLRREKLKQEAEKLKKVNAQLEKDMEILKQANIDTKEIEDIVRSNKAKLASSKRS